MTNLSQQLCKICGIEPKCINCGQTVSDNNPCPKPCDKQKHVNFRNPENFVNLFNLIVSIDSYSYRTDNYTANPEFERVFYINTPADIYKSKLTDPMDAFIGCVIQCAEYEKETAELIKKTEWKYER